MVRILSDLSDQIFLSISHHWRRDFLIFSPSSVIIFRNKISQLLEVYCCFLYSAYWYTVCLKKNLNAPCCCCFSHSACWLPTRKSYYTVANPARGLLNREKRTKEKVWQRTPPPHPPTLLVRRKINKITRRIYRRYAGLGRSRVRTRIPSARRLGIRPMGVASQNSTLPFATTGFPVSLLLSSPGDVLPRLPLN